MAIYRKIDTRIWNDAKFRALSPNGKLAFLFLLTHPNMTALGAMRASIEGLSAELRVPAEAFAEVFREGLPEAFGEAFPIGYAKGFVKGFGSLAIFDQGACCLYIPHFLKYQSAESPNVIKAWAKTLEYIPECKMKTLAVQGAKAFVEGMGEGFRKAFREAFREAIPEDIPKSVSSKQYAVSGPTPPSQNGEITSTTEKAEIGGASQKEDNGGDGGF